MWTRDSLSLVFFFLWAGLGIGPSAEADETPSFSDVLALEEQGELHEALELLGDARLEEQPEHQENLEATLRALQAAEAHAEWRQWSEAQAALDSAGQQLDPVRDRHLARAIYQKKAALKESARIEGAAEERAQRARADAEAAALLAKAGAYFDAGQFAKAADAYGELAGGDAGEVSAELLSRAREGRHRAEAAEIQALTKGFWDEVTRTLYQALRTLAQWLLYLALGLAVLWGIRRYRGTRPGIELDLEDQTATGDQTPANRDLAWDLWHEIERLLPGRAGGESSVETADWVGATLEQVEGRETSDPGADAFSDLHPSSFYMKVDALAPLADLTDESPTIQAGVFSFNPRQLLAFLGHLLRRPARWRLVGSLSGEDAQRVCRVEDRPGSPEGTRLKASHSGADARQRVLRDVASQIAFAWSGSPITGDAGSFRHYQEAMRLLETSDEVGEPTERLQRARLEFQGALRHDPGNWMARFMLATVLSGGAENDLAAAQLEEVERILDAPAQQPELLREFLRQHEDFPLVVRYNRAIALSMIRERRENDQALTILEELIGQITPAATADGESGQAALTDPQKRILLLCHAARASTLLFDFTTRLPREDDDHFQTRQDGKLRQIEAHWTAIQQLGCDASHQRVFAEAYSVAATAMGRARFLLGHRARALAALRQAITRNPDLAEAYLIRADVYLKKWTKTADVAELGALIERDLDSALVSTSSPSRALFRKGTLYYKLGDYHRAKEELAKIEDHPGSQRLLAEIAGTERDLATAVEHMRRSILLYPRPDYRYRRFIIWALRLYAKQPDWRLLQEARQRALDLKNGAEKTSDRHTSHGLLAEIAAAKGDLLTGVKNMRESLQHNRNSYRGIRLFTKWVVDLSATIPCKELLSEARGYVAAFQKSKKTPKDQSSSHRLLADIAAAEEDLAAAVHHLRGSILLDPRPDYRFRRFITHAIELSETTPNDDLLAEARRYARRLQKTGETEEARSDAERLLQEIERRIGLPSEPAAPRPEAEA